MKFTELRIDIRPHTADVHDWNCVEMTPQSIVFRPSSRTLLRRFGATLFAAILIGILTSFVLYARNSDARRSLIRDVPSSQQETQTVMESVRESMTEEEWRRIRESTAEQHALRQAEQEAADGRRRQIGDIAITVYFAVCGIIGVLGILAPLSTLWDRVSIAVIGRNRIAVTSRGIWSRTRDTTIERDTRLVVRAAEKVARRRHAGIARLGHRWMVRIEPAPSLARLGSSVETIDLEVHHQKDRPVEGMPLPPRVRRIVEALQRMTGLTAGPPEILDYQAARSFFGGRGRMVSNRTGPFVSTQMYVGDPVVSSRTVQYNEMGPEMRAQFEAFRKRAGAQPDEIVTAEVVSEHGAVTLRDENGTVRTYGSIDEMPEDIRAIFEMARRTSNDQNDRR